MRSVLVFLVALGGLGCGRSTKPQGGATEGGSGSGVPHAPPTIKEEMVAISGGPFRGRTAVCSPDSLQPVSPAAEGSDRHGVSVDLKVGAFAIDKKNVECFELSECEKAGACKRTSLPSECMGGIALATVAEATAYCAWRKATLPSLYEWQRALRGITGNAYPWGQDARDETCKSEGSDAACHFESQDGVEVRIGPNANIEWTRDTDCGHDGSDQAARLPLVVDTQTYRLDEIETEIPAYTQATFRCVRPAI